jgi:uncharacterized protein YjbJ (UPF0337 family)
MNWDRIEGGWKQLVGKAQQAWCRLTDDGHGTAAGRRIELAGKLQSRYGVSRLVANRGIGGPRVGGDRWFTRRSSARI